MRIVLAGATGAIGRQLLPLLVAAGHEVTGTTRQRNRFEQIAAAGGTPVLADVLDRQAICTAVAEARPEVVLHQLTDLSGRDFAANARLRIEGTRNLVDAALAVGVRRVIAQSIAWVYEPGPAPAHEDEPLDRARMAAVQALEETVAEAPEWVVLRYGLLYGPGTWYAPDGLMTTAIRGGQLATTTGVDSFVHVADAARAAVAALSWPSGIMNIVDDEPASKAEWLPVYAELVGAPPPPSGGGAQAWERGATNAKARALGWQPQYPRWRDGFRDVLR
jgi:nucleoside-diphosphate-sugar epimerase